MDIYPALVREKGIRLFCLNYIIITNSSRIVKGVEKLFLCRGFEKIRVNIAVSGGNNRSEGRKCRNNKEEKDMKVTVERDGCIGCGVCAEMCPEVFRIADDGLSEVYGDVTAANSDSVLSAAQSCPVEVIKVD